VSSYTPGKRYWGRVSDQKLSESKQGNPQIVLEFELQGIIDPSEPDGQLEYCAPGKRTVWLTITDKTIDFVKRDLERLGFTGAPSQLDPDDARFVSLVGKEVELSCKSELYSGNPREKWSIGGGGMSLDSPKAGVNWMRCSA
jgi:hypothetical protein